MKTFYTIVYPVRGGEDTDIAYFDNKKIADDFYYGPGESGLERPRVHNLRDPEKIKKYNKLVDETNKLFLGWLI